MNTKLLLILAGSMSALTHAQTSQSLEEYAKEKGIPFLTASNGRYQETFTNPKLKRIGTVMFNTEKNEVEYFITEGDTAFESAYNRSCENSRWLSIDPKVAKYPSMSPYNFGANSPVWVIDPDGGDIIVLSAPQGAGGLGHAAVLIGNDKDGWTLYSKNGTFGSIDGSASSGPSNKHPQAGVFVGSLDNFALKYNLTEDGKSVEYKSAFRITTNKDQDAKMSTAAEKSVKSFYNVANNSCIDVCTDALNAGGLDGGYTEEPVDFTFEGENLGSGIIKVKSPIPNKRYETIKQNNTGTDATKAITPTTTQIAQKKQEYAKKQEVKQDILDNSGNKQGAVAPKDNTIVTPR